MIHDLSVRAVAANIVAQYLLQQWANTKLLGLESKPLATGDGKGHTWNEESKTTQNGKAIKCTVI